VAGSSGAHDPICRKNPSRRRNAQNQCTNSVYVHFDSTFGVFVRSRHGVYRELSRLLFGGLFAKMALNERCNWQVGTFKHGCLRLLTCSLICVRSHDLMTTDSRFEPIDLFARVAPAQSIGQRMCWETRASSPGSRQLGYPVVRLLVFVPVSFTPIRAFPNA
jgi:hypothetical protein